MNRVSSDNANMRNTEAYANMDCHGELETSRALLVESKQPGASENKPFPFLQWNVNGVFMKLKACHVLSVCLPACLPACLCVCLSVSLSHTRTHPPTYPRRHASTRNCGLVNTHTVSTTEKRRGINKNKKQQQSSRLRLAKEVV